jgi:hypothetical protein
MLVRANVPYKFGDEEAVPQSLKPPTPPVEEVTPPLQAQNQEISIQRAITDFFLPVVQRVNLNPVATTSAETPQAKASEPTKKGGTSNAKRGFNFCNTRNCRYCPI